MSDGRARVGTDFTSLLFDGQRVRHRERRVLVTRELLRMD